MGVDGGQWWVLFGGEDGKMVVMICHIQFFWLLISRRVDVVASMAVIAGYSRLGWSRPTLL